MKYTGMSKIIFTSPRLLNLVCLPSYLSMSREGCREWTACPCRSLVCLSVRYSHPNEIVCSDWNRTAALLYSLLQYLLVFSQDWWSRYSDCNIFSVQRTDRQREREGERERERETVYRSSHQTPVGKCPRQSTVPRPGDSYCPDLKKIPKILTQPLLSLKPKTLTFIILLTIRHTANKTNAIRHATILPSSDVLFIRVENYNMTNSWLILLSVQWSWIHVSSRKQKKNQLLQLFMFFLTLQLFVQNRWSHNAVVYPSSVFNQNVQHSFFLKI